MTRVLPVVFAAVIFAFAVFGATVIGAFGRWNHGLGGWQWWGLLAFLAACLVAIAGSATSELRRRRRRLR